MRRVLLLICVGLISAAAGCGGGDDGDGGKGEINPSKLQRSTAGDSEGAEETVRDYLRALVEKDGGAACAKLAPELQKSMVEQNADLAREKGARDCESLIDAVSKDAPRTTFEGRPLNEKTVGSIPLRVTVRQNGEEENATVTGAQGIQRYELYTTDGRWAIAEIAQGGG